MLQIDRYTQGLTISVSRSSFVLYEQIVTPACVEHCLLTMWPQNKPLYVIKTKSVWQKWQEPRPKHSVTVFNWEVKKKKLGVVNRLEQHLYDAFSGCLFLFRILYVAGRFFYSKQLRPTCHSIIRPDTGIYWETLGETPALNSTGHLLRSDDALGCGTFSLFLERCWIYIEFYIIIHLYTVSG